MKETINIAENDTAQVVVNRAIRRLFRNGTVRLYCKDDYRRAFDIIHSIGCKLRRMDHDAVWQVAKYRDSNDKTVSEFTGFFHESSRINSNPFKEDEND